MVQLSYYLIFRKREAENVNNIPTGTFSVPLRSLLAHELVSVLILILCSWCNTNRYLPTYFNNKGISPSAHVRWLRAQKGYSFPFTPFTRIRVPLHPSPFFQHHLPDDEMISFQRKGSSITGAIHFDNDSGTHDLCVNWLLYSYLYSHEGMRWIKIRLYSFPSFWVDAGPYSITVVEGLTIRLRLLKNVIWWAVGTDSIFGSLSTMHRYYKAFRYWWNAKQCTFCNRKNSRPRSSMETLSK